MNAQIPEGYEPIDFGIPFFQLIGPFYHLKGAPVLHLGMRVEEKHCNSLKTVHGGLLATYADVATVRALVQQAGEDKRAFTLSLNVDYISYATIGAWLEAHVEIKKGAGSVGFATVEIREGDRVVVMATGSFKFITPKPGAGSPEKIEPFNESMAVPDGFRLYDISRMPFMQLLGPVYSKGDDKNLQLGVRVEHKHCNSLGTVHGGFVATLADVAAGRALVNNHVEEKSAMTISLNLDYIGTAKAGAWLDAKVFIKKGTGGVGFCVVDIVEGERLIMSASGAFKFIPRPEGWK